MNIYHLIHFSTIYEYVISHCSQTQSVLSASDLSGITISRLSVNNLGAISSSPQYIFSSLTLFTTHIADFDLLFCMTRSPGYHADTV